MKVTLLALSDDIKQKVGHLTILFAQIEWLCANVAFYSQMSPKQYSQIQDHPIEQKYRETLFSLGMERKLDLLTSLGFDTVNLRRIQAYRNTLAHGIIFQDSDILTVTKPGRQNQMSLNTGELDTNLSLLEDEGGRLIDFLLSKGYKLKQNTDDK